MKMSKLLGWAAVAALAAVPMAPAVQAQDGATLTLTGTFEMVGTQGAIGDDLAQVFANGGDHTWTMVLYGVTYTHPDELTTEVDATSFDLAFQGPDADALNSIVGQHGPGAELYMRNLTNSLGQKASTWWLNPYGVGFSIDNMIVPWIEADADGFPIVSPQTLFAEESHITDASGGYVYSLDDTVRITGDVGEPQPLPAPPPPSVSISDGSVPEGNRGKTRLSVYVALDRTRTQTVTVKFRTVDGTAKARADYTAKSGTLTFLPGERIQAIQLQVKSDRVREPDETFLVELYDATGVEIQDGVGVATILNDD